MTPEKQIEEIWAVLRAMSVRENEIERKFNERMDRAEAKSERDHQKAIKRMADAEKRMEKFDQRLEATRKLVENGMKLVMEMRRQQIADRVEVRRMQKNWDAYFASLKHPRNGHGRH